MTIIRGSDGFDSAKRGVILQVVQNHVTVTSSQSITANVRAEITNLNATITPKFATSKIRITVRWNGEGSHAHNYNTVFGIRRDLTDIGNPDPVGNRATGIAIISQGYYDSDSASTPDSCMYEYIDSPNSTDELVYKGTILTPNSQTIYNNRTVGDDNVGNERLTSTITLEEIGQ